MSSSLVVFDITELRTSSDVSLERKVGQLPEIALQDNRYGKGNKQGDRPRLN